MHSKFNDAGLQEKMLTVNEVAELLSVHPNTIRRWERQGHLKSYRLGPKGNLRFKKTEISNFIESAGSQLNTKTTGLKPGELESEEDEG